MGKLCIITRKMENFIIIAKLPSHLKKIFFNNNLASSYQAWPEVAAIGQILPQTAIVVAKLVFFKSCLRRQGGHIWPSRLSLMTF